MKKLLANKHPEIKDEIIAIEKAIVALSSSFSPSIRWLIMRRSKLGTKTRASNRNGNIKKLVTIHWMGSCRSFIGWYWINIINWNKPVIRL
jgi:hypothetical protein